MKTAELTGALLDYWVARAEGWVLGPQHKILECDVWRDADGGIVGTIPASAYQPSREWVNGGPIIDREKVELFVNHSPLVWSGFITKYAHNVPHWTIQQSGATPLVAAMRAYVASKFGDEVPDEPAVAHQVSAPTGGQVGE